MGIIEVNERGGKQSKIPCRFDLLDPGAMLRLGETLAGGAEKYGSNNWRLIGCNSHINHALHHIFLWMIGDEGEDHLAHAMCRLMMAIATEATNDNLHT